MASKNITLVPAARVREAFNAGEFTAPEAALPSLIGANGSGRVRGRLSPVAVEAFNAQMKGEQYAGEKSPVENKSVTLPLTKTNAKGARLKRPETFPLSEVRALAGVQGKRGRLSAENIRTATAKVEAARGWDSVPAKTAPATAKVPQV